MSPISIIDSLGGIEVLAGLLSGLLAGILANFLIPWQVNKHTASSISILASLVVLFVFLASLIFPFRLILAMVFTLCLTWVLAPALLERTPQDTLLRTKPELPRHLADNKRLEILENMGLIPSRRSLGVVSEKTRRRALEEMGINLRQRTD